MITTHNARNWKSHQISIKEKLPRYAHNQASLLFSLKVEAWLLDFLELESFSPKPWEVLEDPCSPEQNRSSSSKLAKF